MHLQDVLLAPLALYLHLRIVGNVSVLARVEVAALLLLHVGRHKFLVRNDALNDLGSATHAANYSDDDSDHDYDSGHGDSHYQTSGG